MPDIIISKKTANIAAIAATILGLSLTMLGGANIIPTSVGTFFGILLGSVGLLPQVESISSMLERIGLANQYWRAPIIAILLAAPVALASVIGFRLAVGAWPY